MKDDLWRDGERLTQREYKLSPTSGSGRGFDKLDAKDEDFRADTKTSRSNSLGVTFKDVLDIKLQAAQNHRQFFIHSIPIYETGGLNLADSVFITSHRFGKSLINNYRNVQELLEICEFFRERLGKKLNPLPFCHTPDIEHHEFDIMQDRYFKLKDSL